MKETAGHHELQDSSSIEEVRGRARDVFPLALTSVERLHLAESAGRYPNDICCHLRISGPIDRERLDQALVHTLARHPLVSAKLNRQGRRSEWTWSSAAEFSQVYWSTSDSSNDAPPIDLDVGRNVVVRAVADEASGSTRLWIRSHHAVCDGVGGIQFVNDMLQIYDNLVRGRAASAGLHRTDPATLRNRNHLRLLGRRYLKHTVKQPIAIAGASKFLFRKIRPLEVAPIGADDSASSFPRIVGTWFTRDQSTAMLEAARRRSISLNAWVLGGLFAFLLQHPGGQSFRDGGWLRILFPMNLRDISDRRMPACNRTALVQIDRRRDQIADAQTFYHYLNREIGLIRQWQLNKLFLLVVRGMAWVPGWLESSVAKTTCRGAAIFTSLGSPIRRVIPREDSRPRVGNARIEEFDFVGPVRHGTPIYVCLQRESSRIRLSIRFDPHVFTDQSATEFTAAFIDFMNRLSSSEA